MQDGMKDSMGMTKRGPVSVGYLAAAPLPPPAYASLCVFPMFLLCFASASTAVSLLSNDL